MTRRFLVGFAMFFLLIASAANSNAAPSSASSAPSQDVVEIPITGIPVDDPTTSLVWEISDIESTVTWQEALDYCNNFPINYISAWRLPNIKQLESIVDETTFNLAIDPLFTDAKSTYYWSSTTYAGNPRLAWAVDFSDGDVIAQDKMNRFHVRCVYIGVQQW